MQKQNRKFGERHQNGLTQFPLQLQCFSAASRDTLQTKPPPPVLPLCADTRRDPPRQHRPFWKIWEYKKIVQQSQDKVKK